MPKPKEAALRTFGAKTDSEGTTRYFVLFSVKFSKYEDVQTLEIRTTDDYNRIKKYKISNGPWRCDEKWPLILLRCWKQCSPNRVSKLRFELQEEGRNYTYIESSQLVPKRFNSPLPTFFDSDGESEGRVPDTNDDLLANFSVNRN